MKKVVVSDIQKSIDDGNVSLSARVEVQGWKIPDRGDPPQRMFFQYPQEFEGMIAERGDAFVPGLMLQCMQVGSELHIQGPVSQTLLRNTHVYQDIWLEWGRREYQRIDVRADTIDQTDYEPQKTASFFSLGVDSFYSLMKSRDSESLTPAVDFLIHLRGFEHLLNQEQTDEKLIIDSIDRVAKRNDCRPLIGRTNLRQFIGLKWQRVVGAVQGAVRLSLSRGLATTIVPSHASYFELKGSEGNHPLTDPLWVNETCKVLYDGAEKTRAYKIATIVEQMPEALDSLRVCWKNINDSPNCGRCLKCVRTTLVLDMLGKLGQTSTFPDQVTRDFVRILVNYPAVETLWVDDFLRMALELDDQRYIKPLQRICRMRRKDEYLRELYPTYDRITRPLRQKLRRLYY